MAKYLDGIRNRKPAHWRAPEIVILIRALHKLGVRRKVIMAMTGVSETGITHYVTQSKKHQLRQNIAQPGDADLMDAAVKLAHFTARRCGSPHELQVRETAIYG